MSLKAGNLLWSRQRLTIPAAINGGGPGILDVDTGLTQVGCAWNNMSINEPSFSNPSRIQVIPLSPISGWTEGPVTHGEPFFSPTTRTIHVEFSNPDIDPTVINVLFWDPHSLIGPGDADTYNA